MFIELKGGEDCYAGFYDEIYLNVNYIIKVSGESDNGDRVTCRIEYMTAENPILVIGTVKEIKAKIKDVIKNFI